MVVKMGRPREHDQATAEALLAAAEHIAEQDGVDAVSVRRVASHIGTTTRAVYSLFGSKDGLVAALGAHSFDLLGSALDALPATDNPGADLVEAGAVVFRSFACSHPSLFRIAVQRTTIQPELAARFRPAADAALARLEQRIGRLDYAGLLGGRSTHEAACQFHALCEGLAALELRGVFVPESDPERFWRSALSALVAGLAAAPDRGQPGPPRADRADTAAARPAAGASRRPR
jgi:AcrR family transcriptional regulator